MNRTSTIRTAAMALALVSSAASNARAQYRAREALARVDTTTHTASTIARDSSTVAPGIKRQSPRGPGNFYIGLAAGASMPSGEFRNDYRDGWNAAVPIGWRPANSPLGMRLDVSYSKWGGATVDGVKLQSAAVWDGMLDATVDMPFGANRTSSFYLIGGGGVHYFPSYGSESYSTPTPGDSTRTPPPPGGYPQVNSTVTTSEPSSTTRFGLNGGAGISFGLPQRSALFMETRYVTVFTKNERTNYWPLVAGIRWTVR
jgi:opacity protein-like surface antigen